MAENLAQKIHIGKELFLNIYKAKKTHERSELHVLYGDISEQIEKDAKNDWYTFFYIALIKPQSEIVILNYKEFDDDNDLVNDEIIIYIRNLWIEIFAF